jgi:hypothetical protein
MTALPTMPSSATPTVEPASTATWTPTTAPTFTATPDKRSQLSIADVARFEGNKGKTSFSFTLRAIPAPVGSISVNFATVQGSATSGVDYNARSGTVSFLPGQTTKTVNIAVLGDRIVEADETFTVRLSSPLGEAIISKADGIGTIRNDEAIGVKAKR